MKYYRLGFNQEAPTGLAREPEGMDLLEARRLESLPLSLDAEPVDYQPNFLVWPLCSAKLRRILDDLKSPRDSVEWIPVELSVPGRRLQYFRFKSQPLPELLHPDTLMASDTVVKPVLDLDRIKPHKVFVFEEDTTNIVVDQTVRDAITKAKCTGMIFMNVLTAVRQ
jgi:hypothetical protein